MAQETKFASPTGPSPIALSRVYAKGWMAGARLGIETPDEPTIAAMNPYEMEIERNRWDDGFREAMTRRSRS